MQLDSNAPGSINCNSNLVQFQWPFQRKKSLPIENFIKVYYSIICIDVLPAIVFNVCLTGNAWLELNLGLLSRCNFPIYPYQKKQKPKAYLFDRVQSVSEKQGPTSELVPYVSISVFYETVFRLPLCVPQTQIHNCGSELNTESRFGISIYLRNVLPHTKINLSYFKNGDR